MFLHALTDAGKGGIATQTQDGQSTKKSLIINVLGKPEGKAKSAIVQVLTNPSDKKDDVGKGHGFCVRNHS